MSIAKEDIVKKIYLKYVDKIKPIILLIKENDTSQIPTIISIIVTDIVPQMMVDVGAIKQLSGVEKKQVILEVIDLTITEAFSELNQIPSFAASGYDELIRDLLLKITGPLINTFISVENNQIVFNKKNKLFSCCIKN
jgi:hypothetical protein